MRRMRASWLVGAAVAVLLAACGDAGLEVEDTAAGEVVEEDAEPDEPTEPGADEPIEDEGSDADGTVDAGAPDQEAAPGQRDAAVTCDLAAQSGTTELDREAYERTMLDANFELEILVMDLAAELDGYLAGVSDEAAYAEQLRVLQDGWVEVTTPVRGLASPVDAQPWHDRAVASFDRVCTTLADGLAGVEDDDQARTEAHREAVQGFPSVLNELHANAACGPGESC